MGMRMPGWFDITDFGGDVMTRREDVDGILKSVELLHSIVDEQVEKGVPSERIVIGGFSQGGAIALLAGLSSPHKLGGIVGLSTWLTCVDRIPNLIKDVNKETAIFQAHGEADPLVRLSWAEMSRDILRDTYGRTVNWHSYPDLQHSADPQEIDALQNWLEQRIPPLDS